jgi:hypothetical protein
VILASAAVPVTNRRESPPETFEMIWPGILSGGVVPFRVQFSSLIELHPSVVTGVRRDV